MDAQRTPGEVAWQHTDDEHAPGRGLQRDGADGEDGAAEVDLVAEHVEDPDSAAELELGVDGGADLAGLGIDVVALGSEPEQRLPPFVVPVHEDEPPRRLGNEEEHDAQDHGNDVDDAQWN